jgi:signal peptidase I
MVKKNLTKEYLESIIIAVLIAFFIRTFFMQTFKIPSGSNETNVTGRRLLNCK